MIQLNVNDYRNGFKEYSVSITWDASNTIADLFAKLSETFLCSQDKISAILPFYGEVCGSTSKKTLEEQISKRFDSPISLGAVLDKYRVMPLSAGFSSSIRPFGLVSVYK